jgi:hypothetical protein
MKNRMLPKLCSHILFVQHLTTWILRALLVVVHWRWHDPSRPALHRRSKNENFNFSWWLTYGRVQVDTQCQCIRYISSPQNYCKSILQTCKCRPAEIDHRHVSNLKKLSLHKYGKYCVVDLKRWLKLCRLYAAVSNKYANRLLAS